MNTTTLQYSELWRLHHADPNNTAVRREIHLRDQGESDHQMWPSINDHETMPLPFDMSELIDAAEDAERSARKAESEASDCYESAKTLRSLIEKL